MKPALEIKNISKKYNIQANNKPYLSLRESSFLKPRTKKEAFWALNDVSFNGKPVDIVGIVGENGAVKSKLLKILSKITATTSGDVIGRGRVASLLEVGTGFHSELSSRTKLEVTILEECTCPHKIVDTGSDFARCEVYNFGYIITNCKWGKF